LKPGVETSFAHVIAALYHEGDERKQYITRARLCTTITDVMRNDRATHVFPKFTVKRQAGAHGILPYQQDRDPTMASSDESSTDGDDDEPDGEQARIVRPRPRMERHVRRRLQQAGAQADAPPDRADPPEQAQQDLQDQVEIRPQERRQLDDWDVDSASSGSGGINRHLREPIVESSDDQQEPKEESDVSNTAHSVPAPHEVDDRSMDRFSPQTSTDVESRSPARSIGTEGQRRRRISRISLQWQPPDGFSNTFPDRTTPD
jgi:hypothetical protein